MTDANQGNVNPMLPMFSLMTGINVAPALSRQAGGAVEGQAVSRGNGRDRHHRDLRHPAAGGCCRMVPHEAQRKQDGQQRPGCGVSRDAVTTAVQGRDFWTR